jgi:hypothetical protein
MSNRIEKTIRHGERDQLRAAWLAEHVAARSSRTAGDIASEWVHLERAHVFSQPMATAHIRTHLAMLGYGIRRHDRRDIVGQLLRLAVAGPGSFTGRYPVGNTGGAGISALKVLPIPEDLRAVIGVRS